MQVVESVVCVPPFSPCEWFRRQSAVAFSSRDASAQRSQSYLTKRQTADRIFCLSVSRTKNHTHEKYVDMLASSGNLLGRIVIKKFSSTHSQPVPSLYTLSNCCTDSKCATCRAWNRCNTRPKSTLTKWKHSRDRSIRRIVPIGGPKYTYCIIPHQQSRTQISNSP